MSDSFVVKSQKDEFNVLACIYLQQFQVIKETAPFKFTILIKPYKGIQSQFQLNILFEYSKDYPNTPLHYELEPLVGLTRDNLNIISKNVEEIVFNSKGKPVVFDIVEEIRIWMHDYLVDGKQIIDQDAYAEKTIQIFERPKFAAFTPVTPENFLAWKKQFDLKRKVVKKEVKENEIVKLSGKEWFLGKHGEVEESEEDDEDEEEISDDSEEEVRMEEKQNDLFG